jgi:hypothetical protein
MIRKAILAAACAASLAGCSTSPTASTSTGANLTSAVSLANNNLAAISGYDIPAACGIIAVAEGYYIQLKPKISAKNQLRAAQAMAAADSICANPPSNVASAFVSLFKAWMAVQSATVVN